jgi:hypothetical protein
MYVRAVSLESDETTIVKIKQKIANIDANIQQTQSDVKERNPASEK